MDYIVGLSLKDWLCCIACDELGAQATHKPGRVALGETTENHEFFSQRTQCALWLRSFFPHAYSHFLLYNLVIWTYADKGLDIII